MSDYPPPSPTATDIIAQWFSRFTASFFGTLFALIVFALMIRFYAEATIGRAVGGALREQTEQKTKH